MWQTGTLNHYATHPILYWVRDLNSSLQIESLGNWPPILTQHLCTPYKNRTYTLSLEDSCTIHCTKRVFIVAIRGFEPLLQEPKSCVTTITPDSNIKEKGILLNTMVQVVFLSNTKLPTKTNLYVPSISCLLLLCISFIFNYTAKISKKFEIHKFLRNILSTIL